MAIEIHVAHADDFLEESTTARMQSSLCLRANNTVGEDCANVIYYMLHMCVFLFALEPLACKCVARGVLGWRWGCRRRDPSPQHNSRTEAILPPHTAHLDMLYSIRPRKDRASCTTRSCAQASTACQFVTCWLSRDHALSALSSQPHVTAEAGCVFCSGC
jgi:hypothetical protein